MFWGTGGAGGRKVFARCRKSNFITKCLNTFVTHCNFFKCLWEESQINSRNWNSEIAGEKTIIDAQAVSDSWGNGSKVSHLAVYEFLSFLRPLILSSCQLATPLYHSVYFSLDCERALRLSYPRTQHCYPDCQGFIKGPAPSKFTSWENNFVHLVSPSRGKFFLNIKRS